MSTVHNSVWFSARLQAHDTVHTQLASSCLYSCVCSPHALLPLTYPCWSCSYPQTTYANEGRTIPGRERGVAKGLMLLLYHEPVTNRHEQPFFLLFISSEKIHLQHKPSQFIRLCLVCCWFVITLFVHDGIKNNNVYYTCNNQGNPPPTHDQPPLTTPKQRVKKKKKKLSSVCGLCILLLSCHPIPMTSHVCVKPYTGTLRNPSSAAPECNRWRHEDYLVLDR